MMISKGFLLRHYDLDSFEVNKAACMQLKSDTLVTWKTRISVLNSRYSYYYFFVFYGVKLICILFFMLLSDLVIPSWNKSLFFQLDFQKSLLLTQVWLIQSSVLALSLIELLLLAMPPHLLWQAGFSVHLQYICSAIGQQLSQCMLTYTPLWMWH